MKYLVKRNPNSSFLFLLSFWLLASRLDHLSHVCSLDWSARIAIHMSDLIIAEQMATFFERREYLKLIAEAELDPKYSLLYADYVLMHSIGISGLDENGHFSQPSPTFIVKELITESSPI